MKNNNLQHGNFFMMNWHWMDDERIYDAKLDLGTEVYSIYIQLITTLYISGNEITYNLKRLSARTGHDAETLEKVINDYALFTVKDGILSCDEVGEGLDKLEASRKQRSEAGRKSGAARRRKAEEAKKLAEQKESDKAEPQPEEPQQTNNNEPDF